VAVNVNEYSPKLKTSGGCRSQTWAKNVERRSPGWRPGRRQSSYSYWVWVWPVLSGGGPLAGLR